MYGYTHTHTINIISIITTVTITRKNQVYGTSFSDVQIKFWKKWYAMIQASDNDCRQTVFLSDALFALQAHQNRLLSLSRSLHQAARTGTAALQPAVESPELSELRSLQRRARQEEPDNSISYSQKMKRHQDTLTAKNTPGWLPTVDRDDYHLWSRQPQTVLMMLPTSHCASSSNNHTHMYWKLKLVLSPTSPCSQEDQTLEQILQTCPVHQAVKHVWLTNTPLTTRLYIVDKSWKKQTHSSPELNCVAACAKKKRIRTLLSWSLSQRSTLQP